MTVKELYDKLGLEIEQGHGELNVIANCDFTIGSFEDKTHYDDYYLCYLNDVYYQSGDIELGFSDKKE